MTTAAIKHLQLESELLIKRFYGTLTIKREAEILLEMYDCYEEMEEFEIELADQRARKYNKDFPWYSKPSSPSSHSSQLIQYYKFGKDIFTGFIYHGLTKTSQPTSNASTEKTYEKLNISPKTRPEPVIEVAYA